jgi:hypothetical protein
VVGLDHAFDDLLGALRAAVGPELGDELALLAAQFRGPSARSRSVAVRIGAGLSTNVTGP